MQLKTTGISPANGRLMGYTKWSCGHKRHPAQTGCISWEFLSCLNDRSILSLVRSQDEIGTLKKRYKSPKIHPSFRIHGNYSSEGEGCTKSRESWEVGEENVFISVHMSVCDGAYPCVIVQDKWRNVDLFRFDAGEELVQVVQVADFVLQPRHTEGGEEPRWKLVVKGWVRVRKKEKHDNSSVVDGIWLQNINLVMTDKDKIDCNKNWNYTTTNDTLIIPDESLATAAKHTVIPFTTKQTVSCVDPVSIHLMMTAILP